MVMDNLKLTNAQEEKVTHAYKNTKDKLHRTNIAISSNHMCRSDHLTPSYIKITITCPSQQTLLQHQAGCHNFQNIKGTQILILKDTYYVRNIT